MDGFSVSRIILGLQNPELLLKKLQNIENNNKIGGFAPEVNSSLANLKQQAAQNVLMNLQNMTQSLQMNYIAGLDLAIFIKNLLGLPENMWQLLMSAQNKNNPLMGGTLGLTNINQELLQNQKTIAALFSDTTPAAKTPIINPDSITLANLQQNVQKDTIALLFSGMVSLSEVSKIILQNSKQAVASLIIAMASASKQGLSNEQIQETLSIINSCIAMAESSNPSQNLKSLMMLYLPWLPLNEGVGFDLEITPDDGEQDSNDSKLTVLIQTKNFGNIKGEFTLTTSNSVDVLITCTENFPKKILQKSLMDESSSHAMNTNIDIEEVVPQKEETNDAHETKVNLSATNEMNPYLLLMAHSFIRNTIIIDNNASLNL